MMENKIIKKKNTTVVDPKQISYAVENSAKVNELVAQTDQIAKEFDSVVANVTNGNESATNTEVVLARGGETTLDARLDKSDDKLNGTSNGMYISDNTVKPEISPMKIFSLEYIQQQQLKLLGEFYRNIKKGILQTICCQGDSLTYGLDVNSVDKRPADATIYPDGTSHGSGSTRAGVTYPEALQTQLRSVLGQDKINVITRGFCGDYVKGGYNKWITPSGANLTIFQYGTNDSRGSWVDYKGDVKQFIIWYEKLISREILRGSAVVIVSPPREPNNDVDIFTFSNALERLAYKYNIPIVRGDELLLNYDNSIFSDELHLNSKGYATHSSRVASALLSRFEKNSVINGSKIGVYANQDNLYMINGSRPFENVNYPTPSQVDVTKGTAIALNNATKDGAICIPFYTSEDDLLVYPNIYINDASPVDVILDFEVEQSLYSNSDLVQKDRRTKPNNKITLSNVKAMYNSRITNEEGYIHIPKKGWHTIILIAKTANTTGFYGLEFINFNYKDVLNKFKKMNKDRVYITSFLNGWKNFASTQDSSYQHLNIYKNDDGEINIRGYINGGTASSITTLPAELRPTKDIITPCYAKYINPDLEKVVFVEITANGGIYFLGDTTNLNRASINIITK